MVKKVGKFEIGRTIGEGRFSKVKFGVDISTGERVAVKIMKKELLVELHSVERVKVEIEILKTIKHRHVVKLMQVLASPTKIYVVMELLSGGELLEKLATTRRFDEITARHYFVQLITGLAHCHSKGVYHRDLKPENLLLDDDENLKIADFGLGALLPPTSPSLLRHSMCGTPNYVAPEVLEGEGYHPGPADLWSCGVILFVLLAGFLPFDEPTDEALFAKIRSSQFRIPNHFSPPASRLIKRLLDPNPKTRMTIHEIKQDRWFSPPELSIVERISSVESHIAITSPKRKHVQSTLEMVEPQVVDQLSVAGRPITNAFELIAVSGALDISTLLQGKKLSKRTKHTRFCSKKKGEEVFHRLREAISTFSFKQKTN